MKNLLYPILLLTLLVGSQSIFASELWQYNIDAHELIIHQGDQSLTIDYKGESYLNTSGTHISVPLVDDKSVHLINVIDGEKKTQYLTYITSDFEVFHIPFWLSIVPPLIAIIAALIFKEVIFSIFIGIFVGAFTLNGFEIHLIPKSLFNVLDKFILSATADSDHMAVILFSILIGGMVAIISKNGGMNGIVDLLARFAKNAKSTQFVTWFLGIFIFFDDYANTLIVGNTMRPVTDKFKISREKLAYIVDSTAAPIAAIAFVTTWIGAELGYIQDFIDKEHLSANAYHLFFNSLRYAYYPILTLIFILFLILMKKDFGPMYDYEMKARKGEMEDTKIKDDGTLEALNPIKGVEAKWYNALIPILTVIITTIVGLLITGTSDDIWDDSSIGFFKKLSVVIGNSDSYITLLWSSLAGCLVAILMTISQRIMGLQESIESLLNGIKTMIPAVAILIFAWSLAKVSADLHTADFLTSLIGSDINPRILPVITFVLAAFISFSTGSSWGTMAILYPLVLPSVWSVCVAQGMPLEKSYEILSPIIAVVLGGSVLGDHCSPISDTTILSSLASHCNHITHVRTQLPYAISVGVVSIILLLLFFFTTIPSIITFALGIAMLYLIVKYLGKEVPEPEQL